MKNASLNHVYRLVWNEILNAWVAVAEHTAARGKRSRAARVMVAGALLGASVAAQAQATAPPTAGATATAAAAALPSAGRIAAGQGRITQAGSSMTVTQDSDRMVVDWGSFSIGRDAGVRFVQPGRDAIALNRVTGTAASRIDGSLSGNGQIWLLNPNGVVFGAGAQVDVGGLVASSLALSNEDFLAGRARFGGGAGVGAVVNHGRLGADGGYVALLGPKVRNDGTIATPRGTAALAAGDVVRLDLADDGLIGVAVERGVVAAEAANRGRLEADGGLAVLTARGAGRVLDSVVNNSGVIEARGLVERGGRILLDGDAEGGTTVVGGRLDATSAGGPGGEITVTGHDIHLAAATLDASGAAGGGAVRVGGGYQGREPGIVRATTVEGDAAAVLRADARRDGDGGQVIVWSDGRTRFAGQVSARGGAEGGDGGLLEVSGRQELQYRGHADARAPHGRTGDLLLDPATITVRGGGSGSGAVDGSVVYEKDLEAQNANVLLEATGSTTFEDLNLNGGDGTITMAPDVGLRVESGMGCGNTTNCSHLAFNDATDTIEVSGTGSIYLQSGNDGWGDIVNAPNLIAHGAGSNPGVMPTHDVTVAGSGTPSAGSITLYGADGVTVGGSLQTNGGYVRIWADSDNMSGGGFTISAPVTTNGGNFLVSAGTANVVLNSNMTLGTGRIVFRADGSYTTGTKVLGGTLQASGNVDVDTRFQMNAGASIYTDGVITFSNTVDLNTGSGALTLRADAIDFSAATLNNLSTASMILQPADPATSMVLGDASGFASAATLAKLPGIRNLTVGRTDGTGTTSVASNFSFDANGTMEVVNQTIDIGGGSLTNTTGHVTLTGDNISIGHPISSNGGAGTVTIRQMTAGTDMHLGSTLPSSATQNVDAATLVIGRVDGGDVVFDADVATTAGSVSLLAGGRVLGVNGGVSAPNLAVTAGGGATLSDSTFDYTTLALKVGGDTQVTRSGTLNLGTVAGVAGLSVDGGSDADVTLQADAIGGSGTIAMNGNGSAVALRADSVDLTGLGVSGQTFTDFTVEPLLAGASFSVGGAGSLIGSTSLSRLDASRNVTVGRHDGTGQLDVTGNVSLSLPGELTLVNGSVRVVSGTVANTVGDLTVEARTGSLLIDRDVGAGSTLTLAAATGGTIGGNGAVAADELAIDASGAEVTLLTAGNAVNTIGATAGSLDYRQAGELAVGFAGNQMGVQTNQMARLRTTDAGADLTLDLGVDSSGTGDAVQLIAGGDFINHAGSNAIGAPNGRWLVWSSNPAHDTRGGLAFDFKQYDATYGDTVLGTGNGFLYEIAPVVTVGLTGSTSKVYDGDTDATLAAGHFTTSGTIDGDDITFSHTGAHYDTRHADTGKTVTAEGLALTGASDGAAPVYGYQLAGTTAAGSIGEITRATLTVGPATVSDRTYDGTTNATVTGIGLAGIVGGDTIGTTATGTFADRHAGAAKSVAVSGITLTGADAGNYTLSSTTTTGQATISRATLTLTGATVADKVYDGTTTASVSGLAASGRFGSDTVTIGGHGAFADKHAGDDKAVSLAGLTLGGADAGNYLLDVSGINATADITPATLTVGTIAVADRVYDGTRHATVSSITLGGVVGGDTVGTSATGLFADRNAGVGKAVAVSGIALTGASAGDYVLATTSGSATATITPATLNLGSATVASRVYDGTTVATVTGLGLSGIVSGDSVGGTATGRFADRNAGTDKAVSVEVTGLTGADAGNYVIGTDDVTARADITPATLNARSATVANRVYDGTTVAQVTGVGFDGLVAGDSVSGVATGRFADRNAGTGKAVAVDVTGLAGADAGNYVIGTDTTTSSADITPATLTLAGATVASRPFDGTRVARVGAVTLGGVVAGDDVGGLATGAFADPNIGRDKPVAVSGVTLDGADAGNYVLASTTTTATASILPAGAGSTTTVSTDTLASLTSPQSGLNGSMAAGDSAGAGVGGGTPGGTAGRSAGSGAGGDAGTAGPSHGAAPLIATGASLVAGGAGTGAGGFVPGPAVGGTAAPMLDLPATVLTQGGQVSIATGPSGDAAGAATGTGTGTGTGSLAGAGNGGAPLGALPGLGDGGEGAAGTLGGATIADGGDASRASSASLPVFSAAPGATPRDEGQFFVSESGGSLSLLAEGRVQLAPPSTRQAVQRSAKANLPISAESSVTMQVDLLADGTLLVRTPAEAGTLSPETLATYGLLVARKSLSVPVDGVKAIVLESAEAASDTAEATAPKS